MADFATQLNHEISRRAEKEVRSEEATFKEASNSYRPEIAPLVKRLASLETLMEKTTKSKVQVAVVEDQSVASEVGKLRLRVAGFASLGEKLGLSATNTGKTLGVGARYVLPLGNRKVETNSRSGESGRRISNTWKA